MATGNKREDEAMTEEEFAARVEKLIRKAHDGGLSDEAMITVLENAVEALDEGLS